MKVPTAHPEWYRGQKDKGVQMKLEWYRGG